MNDKTNDAGRILQDIERELSAIKADMSYEAPSPKDVLRPRLVKRPLARVIDTRSINLNTGIRSTRDIGPAVPPRSLQQRLAAVKASE